LQGTLLVLVGRTANNNLVLLAHQYCSSEDGENLNLFVGRATRDFPTLKEQVGVNDKGGAIGSAFQAFGIKTRMCLFHVKKNVRENYKSVTEELLESVTFYAMCSSKQDADCWEEDAKSSHFCIGALKYIISRREEFVSYYLLEKGVNSHDLLNSMAESVFKMIKPLRKKSIVSMHQGIMELFAEKFEEQKEGARKAREKAEKYGGRCLIVPEIISAVEQGEKRMENKSVVINSVHEFVAIGVVTLSQTGNKTQRVILKRSADVAFDDRIQCSCKRFKELGYPCDCAIALMKEIAKTAGGGKYYGLFSPWWYSERHLVSRWNEQYDFESCFSALNVKNLIVNRLRSWELRPAKPGRKKKTKKKKLVNNKSKTCAGCGEKGHNIKRCERVQLDRVYEMIYKKKCEEAIKIQEMESEKLNNALEEYDEVELVDDVELDSEESDSSESYGDVEFAHDLEARDVGNSNYEEFVRAQVEYGDGDTAFRLAVDESLELDLKLQKEKSNVLQIALEKYGRVENVNILHEGECLFDALYDQLSNMLQGQTLTGHLQLRQLCLNFISNHQQFISLDVLTSLYPDVTSIEQYCEYMSGEKIYGDEICIDAISGMFQVDIVIISSGEHPANERTVSTCDNPAGTIYLGCLLERHFMSLVPSKGLQEDKEMLENRKTAILSKLEEAEPQQKKNKNSSHQTKK
jgi:OTU-like cysteine protease